MIEKPEEIRYLTNIKRLIMPALYVFTLVPTPALPVSLDKVTCATRNECKKAYEQFTKDNRRDQIASRQKEREDWRSKNCNSAGLIQILKKDPNYLKAFFRDTASIKQLLTKQCSSDGALNGLIFHVEGFIKETADLSGKDNVLLCFISENNISQLAAHYWSDRNAPEMPDYLKTTLENNGVLSRCSEQLVNALIDERERYEKEIVGNASQGLNIEKNSLVFWGTVTKDKNPPVATAVSQNTYEAALNSRIQNAIREWTHLDKPVLTKGEFEQTKDFELRKKKAEVEYQEALKRKKQEAKERMPGLYTTTFLDELGPPQVADINYDADLQKFTFSIKASNYSYAIRTTLKVPVENAPAFKNILEETNPIVLFEIKDDESVTPRSVVLLGKGDNPVVAKRLDFTGEQTTQAIHIGEKALANLQEVEKKRLETEAAISRAKEAATRKSVQEQAQKRVEAEAAREKKRQERLSALKPKLDMIWAAYEGYPGNGSDSYFRRLDPKGEMIKVGTVPPSALSSSATGRLNAYLACYDFVGVLTMRNIGSHDEKGDICIYYIDNPSRNNHGIMWRGRDYMYVLEQEMSKDGFRED